MAFTKLNFRCTYAEEERWKESARKTGRSLSAWLRWLANTASDSPLIERVTIAGEVEQIAQPLAKLQPPKPKGFDVNCDRDWDTGLVTVLVNGEDVGWEGEQSVPRLRMPPFEFPPNVIADIRKQLRELN